MHWVDASGIKLISYSSEESASKPKAKFNQETRDFLENLLKDKTLEERIASLERSKRRVKKHLFDTGGKKLMGKIDVMSEIDIEIEEYQEMITHAIQTNNKADLAMWRRALQTAKISKRRLANS